MLFHLFNSVLQEIYFFLSYLIRECLGGRRSLRLFNYIHLFFMSIFYYFVEISLIVVDLPVLRSGYHESVLFSFDYLIPNFFFFFIYFIIIFLIVIFIAVLVIISFERFLLPISVNLNWFRLIILSGSLSRCKFFLIWWVYLFSSIVLLIVLVAILIFCFWNRFLVLANFWWFWRGFFLIVIFISVFIPIRLSGGFDWFLFIYRRFWIFFVIVFIPIFVLIILVKILFSFCFLLFNFHQVLLQWVLFRFFLIICFVEIFHGVILIKNISVH